MTTVAKVTLDRETFKVLASETRLDLLHALDERRKTGTELATELALNKATVHEHLQLLSATGLVKKVDEGRKWIYYELSWQGRNLLHPETGAVFSVLLGLSVLAAGGGFAMLGRALGWWWQAKKSSGDVGPDGARHGFELAAAAPEDESSAMSAQPDDGAPSDGAGDGGEGSYQDINGTQDAAEPGGMGSETDLDQDLLGNDTGFFDDGGFVSITLFVAMAVFLLLAFALRYRRH